MSDVTDDGVISHFSSDSDSDEVNHLKPKPKTQAITGTHTKKLKLKNSIYVCTDKREMQTVSINRLTEDFVGDEPRVENFVDSFVSPVKRVDASVVMSMEDKSADKVDHEAVGRVDEIDLFQSSDEESGVRCVVKTDRRMDVQTEGLDGRWDG